ncbi:MAG TPA: L,D-transpeptidase [Candidatus Dormibacteraeota bacterium]
MRVVVMVATAGVALALCAAGGSLTAVASGRHTQFTTQATALQNEWVKDVSAGVPAANIAPLKNTLQQSADSQSAWWSPHWWGDTGQPLIDQLHRQTTTVWNAAMSAGRTQARSVVTLWSQLNQQLGSYIPTDLSATAAQWPAQLASAGSPKQLQQLAKAWLGDVATARSKATTNQLTAELNASVSGYGGVDGLVTDAQSAVSTAQADNLDTGDVPTLIAAVQNDYQGDVVQSADATNAVQRLVNADSSLRSLIALNDNVNALIKPLEYSADQAAAESTPNNAALMTQFDSVQQAFHAAANTDQLTAVENQISTVQNSINTELAANVCGHNVGAGKVITFNLALQEGVFYQDGCVVKATPVTTGRPELRTPTGNFSIFYKQSPFQFISPWPPSSPFYYVPSWTNWVMEFASGGYFIHDAPWEPADLYGPGGEDTSGASHGCIHVPHDVMQWLYGWTPEGTPVIIT